MVARGREVGTDPVGREFRHLGHRELDVVRQGVDTVSMKQMRGDAAIPDRREPPTHVDDVVVHTEGFLQHDHGSPHGDVRYHLVGGHGSVGSGQQQAVVVHGRTLVPLVLAEAVGQPAEHRAVENRCLAADDVALDDLEHDDLGRLD
jgi:hypothetical protein